MNGKERSTGHTLLRGIIVILVGIVIWFLPIPTGVKPAAWHLLAIFVATIVGLILTPLPMRAASSGGRSWGCGKPWSGGGENPPPPGFRPPPAAESHGQKMLHDFRKLADKSIDTLLSPWKSRR